MKKKFENSRKNKEFKINDPVHGLMIFKKGDAEIVKKIIDTKAFQRLRKTSQLGLTSYVFPGAVHTRFSHSIGAAFLSLKVLDHLKENSKYKKEITPKDRKIVLAATLLHDIGHGPFSHSFEKACCAITGKQEKSLIPSHEEWTSAIITGDHEIKKSLLQELKFNQIDIKKIVSLIVSENGEGQNESDGMPNEYKNKKRYIKQIVSSQIDVDRMDYLLRDSYSAGVEIGKVDIDYLISSLEIVPHLGGNQKTLGLYEKGIRSYETFAFARHMMNRSVYFHQRVKASEAMIERFIKLAIEEPRSIKNQQLIPDYLISLKKYLGKKEKYREDKKIFLKKNLEKYIQLTENSIWHLVDGIAKYQKNDKPKSIIVDLALKIQNKEKVTSHKIKKGMEKIVKRELDRTNLSKEVDVVELKSTLYEGQNKDGVFVVTSGKVSEVNKISESIEKMSQLTFFFNSREQYEHIAVVFSNNNRKKVKIKKICDSYSKITTKKAA